MVLIQVKLTVTNFDLLDQFEREAVKVMAKYQGRILSAFEIARKDNGSGEEIHILAFPSLQLFEQYREDDYLASLSKLRKQAIASTEVYISSQIKSYH